jgi:hypothetical protein
VLPVEADDLCRQIRTAHAVPLVLGGVSVTIRTTASAVRAALAYESFESWAISSFDIVRPYLVAAAFPLFAHAVINLALQGAGDATSPIDVLAFFDAHAPLFATSWRRELPAIRMFAAKPGRARDPAQQLMQSGWWRPSPTAPLGSAHAPTALKSVLEDAAGLGEGEVVSRLLDPAYRFPVVLTPMALELLLEFLARSASVTLLAILNERAAITVTPPQSGRAVAAALVAGGPFPASQQPPLPVPIHDVAAGVLRASDPVANSFRWGVRRMMRAGGGSASLQPATPALAMPQGEHVFPDYAGTAFGQSIVSAAAAAQSLATRVTQARGPIFGLEAAIRTSPPGAPSAHRLALSRSASFGRGASVPAGSRPPSATAAVSSDFEVARLGVVSHSSSGGSVQRKPSGATASSGSSGVSAPVPTMVNCCTMRESLSPDADPDNVLRVAAVGSRSGVVSVFVTLAVLFSSAPAAPDRDASAKAPQMRVKETDIEFQSAPQPNAAVYGVALSPCLR